MQAQSSTSHLNQIVDHHGNPIDPNGDWRPGSLPQERFLTLKCFEALYGGAAGGGKSDAIMIDAIRYLGRGYGRGYNALILRREFPDLEMSLMRRAHVLYPRVGGKWNGTTKTWTFPQGETVRFGHAQHEQDVLQYRGAEFQYVGFDELTTFSEYQYIYLISRLRSSRGVPLRLRGGTNPGGVGHEWVFRRFAPWLNPESPIRARPGQILHVGREDGEERLSFDATPGTLGRTFIPASAKDNPFLNDGTYERALDELDPVTRAQLKFGDWLAHPAAGLFFKQKWFKPIAFAEELLSEDDVKANRRIRRIRYWDRAATEPHEGNRDPDWTVGIKIAYLPNKQVVIEDVVRLRANPGDVEKCIRETARMDGKDVWIGIEQDPGQAGKFEAGYYIRAFSGWTVKAFPVTKAKDVRAGPISSQCEGGNVYYVKGRWNDQFFRELEEFPEANHDDQVDALSGAFAALSSTPPVPYGAKMPTIIL